MSAIVSLRTALANQLLYVFKPTISQVNLVTKYVSIITNSSIYDSKRIDTSIYCSNKQLKQDSSKVESIVKDGFLQTNLLFFDSKRFLSYNQRTKGTIGDDFLELVH
ncbi:MAG: hypothetical protein QXP36_14760, partial [Conexivisphaerales archaeon]